jgi:tetratricopeptide (TPR) repeat protein
MRANLRAIARSPKGRNFPAYPSSHRSLERSDKLHTIDLGRRLFGATTLALLLAGISCKQKEVRPEELFQSQALGLAYLETGQLPQAESAFKKVIGLAPKDPAGYANLGVTYLRASRFPDAGAQHERAR